jgi:hypothetical protein
VSVGAEVGAFVGLREGASVGALVGAKVGLLVGLVVGAFVGLREGASVGVSVGAKVGLLVGAVVGAFVGFLVGLDVGWSVGSGVGSSVGITTGGEGSGVPTGWADDRVAARKRSVSRESFIVGACFRLSSLRVCLRKKDNHCNYSPDPMAADQNSSDRLTCALKWELLLTPTKIPVVARAAVVSQAARPNALSYDLPSATDWSTFPLRTL